MHNEFTWLGALSVFWAITWRTLLIGIPLALIVGALIGVIGYFQGLTNETIAQYGGISGQLVMIPVYIYVIKRLFTKGFGNYRLQVIEKE